MKQEKYNWRLTFGLILASLCSTACVGPSEEQGAKQSGQTKGVKERPAVILKAYESGNPHLEVRQCILIFKQGPNFRMSPVDCEGAPPQQVEYKTYKLKTTCTPPSPSCEKYTFKAKVKGGGHTEWIDHDVVLKVKDVDGDNVPDFDSDGLPIVVQLDPAPHTQNDDHDIPGRSGGSHGGSAHYR